MILRHIRDRRGLKGSTIVASSGSSAHALVANTTHFWDMDEASGNVVDEVSGVTLTDVNTVGTATGLVNNARLFVRANSEYFEAADSSVLSKADVDFSFVCWVKATSTGIVQGVFAKNSGAAGNKSYICHINASNKFVWGMSADGSAVTSQISTGDSVTTTGWTMIYCFHDSVNNLMGLSVNNGTVESRAFTTGGFVSTEVFRIGWRDSGNVANAAIDQFAAFDKVLSASDLTYLYNAGAGRAYPFTT